MIHSICFPWNRVARAATIALSAGLLCGHSLIAEEAKSAKPPIETPAEDPLFSNWMDLSLGGLISHGNDAQFHQTNPVLGPIFGGIEDMHLEKSLGKALMTLDAHAIFADSDYKVKFEISQPDLGFIRAGFTEFCTYYNGNGGYLPPNAGLPGGQFFAGPEFALYRGSLWVELGLRLPHFPELTVRYEHAFRSGQEDSTSWGPTSQTGIAATRNYNPATNSERRRIVPSFRNISETRDIFTFEGKYLFGKPEAFGNTEVNLGMRYEFDRTNDSLNSQNEPGAPTTPVATNYYITQVDSVSLALYNGHISTVTHLGEKLWLTTGFSYAAASSDLGGSRVGGPAYGVPYKPFYGDVPYANVPRGAYIDLGGGSNVGQSVAAFNIMWMPFECLTIAPSVRVECNNTTSTSTYLSEVPVTAKGQTGLAIAPTIANTQIFLTDIAESLQIRYTGLRDVQLYAQCDWDQQYESRGQTTPSGSLNKYSSSRLNLSANNSLLMQKYALGANWYPLAHLNASIQYYLQFQDISQNIHADDPEQDNQRLYNQHWTTNDVNFRVTWQPFSTLSLVSRYDFQRTVVDSQWGNDGDPLNTFIAPNGQSSLMTNSMITESITWSPLDRLFVQGSLSYVMNTTSSAASQITQAITNSNNNYWTASAGFGFAIDPKTELRGDCSLYSANNYQNNSVYGVPYGAGGTEYNFSASLSRQISTNVRLTVKYYFDTYRDQLSGGNSNYTAQMITSSLQVRF